MSDNVTIVNDYGYLATQALGWDYNLWTIIIVDVGSLILIFGIIFLVFVIGVYFNWWR